eukprot:CAMPEP_0180229752 /NCGR_PEP_ID=MMETSP0987-20121128/25753_1 /TAXON_ID=697907 /ORGANISM="non described non described, Strain CCMP2293" /LENGTH=428 /DNA_ID=CAMNT_0022194611 /DNA_START=21 /DNA_END=1304 /DNA_ORIENTATION=-
MPQGTGAQQPLLRRKTVGSVRPATSSGASRSGQEEMNARRPQQERLRLQRTNSLLLSLRVLRAGAQSSCRPAPRDDLAPSQPAAQPAARSCGPRLMRTDSRTVPSMHEVTATAIREPRLARTVSTPTGGFRRTTSTVEAFTRVTSLPESASPLSELRRSELLRSDARAHAPNAAHADFYRTRSEARSTSRTVPFPFGPHNTPAEQHAAPSSWFEALDAERATLAKHRTHLTRSSACTPNARPSTAAMSRGEAPASFHEALEGERVRREATLTAQRARLTRSTARPVSLDASSAAPSSPHEGAADALATQHEAPTSFHAALDLERFRRAETLTTQRARLTRSNARPASLDAWSAVSAQPHESHKGAAGASPPPSAPSERRPQASRPRTWSAADPQGIAQDLFGRLVEGRWDEADSCLEMLDAMGVALRA